MTKQNPPQAPARPTKRDLDVFMRRTKAALRAAGLSQRQTETTIGMPRGTLSKLFSGRLALALKTLREIAQQAKVEAHVLVDGTALAKLLLGAPESEEGEVSVAVQTAYDELRAELAARDGLISELRRQLDGLATRVRELEREVADAAEVRGELARAREAIATAERLAADSAKRAIVVARRDEQLAAAVSRATETTTQLAGWRAYALERNQRVNFLESELAKGYQAARQRSGDEAGRLLLTVLAGVGVGALIGKSSG